MEEATGCFKVYRISTVSRDYVKTMGYTHVELMPVMEHPSDESMGYQTTGYFYLPAGLELRGFYGICGCASSGGNRSYLRLGTISIAKDEFALASFDGTCLYEYEDPKRNSSTVGDFDF